MGRDRSPPGLVTRPCPRPEPAPRERLAFSDNEPGFAGLVAPAAGILTRARTAHRSSRSRRCASRMLSAAPVVGQERRTPISLTPRRSALPREAQHPPIRHTPSRADTWLSNSAVSCWYGVMAPNTRLNRSRKAGEESGRQPKAMAHRHSCRSTRRRSWWLVWARQACSRTGEGR